MEEHQDTHGDMAETVTMLSERQQDCPLCNSAVKFFFINLSEKILICENPECDYPFGHEEIKFYKDCDYQQTDDFSSMKSMNTASVAASTISSSAWADIEQMNKVYDSEESQFNSKPINEVKDKKFKIQTEAKFEEQLTKNLENIKELSKAMMETTEQKAQCITNERWLKNLMNKQISGRKLLKQGELTKLKKTEVSLGATELKININPTENNVSLIRIELAKP